MLEADQAQGLRRLFGPPVLRVLPLCCDDDDGFAQFAGTLAASAVAAGRRVVLLDGDRGRIAPTLGLKARWDLLHVLSGECDIDAAMLADPRGFAVLPAARGLDALDDRADAERMLAAFGAVGDGHDLVILAAPAARLVRALGAECEPTLVAPVEPTAAQQVYARIKSMREKQGVAHVRVVWRTGAQRASQAAGVHGRLAAACRRFLRVEACDGGAFADAHDAQGMGRIAGLALAADLPEFEAPRTRRGSDAETASARASRLALA